MNIYEFDIEELEKLLEVLLTFQVACTTEKAVDKIDLLIRSVHREINKLTVKGNIGG